MIGLYRGSIPRLAATAGAAAAALSLVAACSSSGSSNSSATSGGASSGVAAAAGSSSAAATTATVGTRSGPLGNYLVDGSGRTLYLFASDRTNVSTCTGSCLTYWPPLTSAGKPSATGGVNSSLLATFTSGNANWVSYAGHPLYYFLLDKAAGDIKGQGSTNFGAKWWLVAPSGQPITGSASGSSASSASDSAGGSGGGGYGG